VGIQAQEGVAGTSEPGTSRSVVKVAVAALVIVVVAVGAGVYIAGRHIAAPTADENSMALPIDHGPPPSMPYGSPKQPAAKPMQPKQADQPQSWGP